MIRLITHSGFCHSDDVLAYAVLSKLFPKHRLIRTRDEVLINYFVNAVVFDVGMKYDGITYFDHHQKEKQMRDDGVPYSSFGLIWRKFGERFLKEVLPSAQYVQEVWKHIDEKFVRLIDIGDNGIENEDTHLVLNPHSFSRILCLSHDGTDESFKEIAKFAQATLIGMCKKAHAYNEDIDLFQQAELLADGRILLLTKQPRDFSPVNLHPNKETIYYIVSPRDEEGKWQVNTFRVGQFGSRKDLFSKAAGLTDDELVAATGIPDLTFCHTAKFIAVGKTKESVIALAKLSLEE